MSLENEMKNQTLAIKEQTAAITAQTAAMTELFNNFIFNAVSSASSAMTVDVDGTNEAIEKGMGKGASVTVEIKNEKASQADNETADKINSEAKKKSLDEAKAKAKKEAEEKIEQDAQAGNELPEHEVSADDLKAACLTAARAEEGNKVKVKALLSQYDATVVKDVAPGDRAAILAKLESGDF